MRRKTNLDRREVVVETILITVFFVLLFGAPASCIGYAVYTYPHWHAIDVCNRTNPLHCGEVDVTTPSGNHAVEHQCWREHVCPE